MTKVLMVTVEEIERGAKMGGHGFGVYVHAERDGKPIVTCVETSGIRDDMVARARKHAKRLGVEFK